MPGFFKLPEAERPVLPLYRGEEFYFLVYRASNKLKLEGKEKEAKEFITLAFEEHSHTNLLLLLLRYFRVQLPHPAIDCK